MSSNLKSEGVIPVDLKPDEVIPEVRRQPSGTPKPVDIRDRLTFSITLVHEHHPDIPFEVSVRGSNRLKTKNISARRQIDIEKGRFVILDYGWLVGKVGTVVLRNITGIEQV